MKSFNKLFKVEKKPQKLKSRKKQKQLKNPTCKLKPLNTTHPKANNQEKQKTIKPLKNNKDHR